MPVSKRPVAFRAPTGRGGWIVTQDEQEAIDVAAGADYEGLYARPLPGADLLIAARAVLAVTQGKSFPPAIQVPLDDLAAAVRKAEGKE